MRQVFHRKYNADASVYGVCLKTRGAQDYQVNPTLAAGDVLISKDGGAFANIATLPYPLPAGDLSLRLLISAAELSAKRVVVKFIDQTNPKEWEDEAIIVETYGDALAMHPFDLGAASVPQTGDAFARLGAPVGASVSADVAAVKAEVDTHPTLTEIEASTVLALQATSQSILNEANTHPTLTEIEASTVLAKEATASAIKTKTDKLQFDASNYVNSTHAYASGAVVSDVGNGGSKFKTDLVATVDDTIRDCWIKFEAPSALAGQVKRCVSYNGTTKFIDVSAPYTGVPAPGDTFKIINE